MNSMNVNICSYKTEKEPSLTQLHEEYSLSLRKQRYEDKIALSRRNKKTMSSFHNNINNNNSNSSNNSLEINQKDIEQHVSEILLREYEIYDDKISVINSFLNEDFSLLDKNNISYERKWILLFALYSLRIFTIQNSNDEQNLLPLYSPLIKLLMKENDLQILYEITYIIINLPLCCSKLENLLLQDNIWKRLLHISTHCNNFEITCNVLWFFKNISSTEDVIATIIDRTDFIKCYNTFLDTCANECSLITKYSVDVYNVVILLKRVIGFKYERIIDVFGESYYHLIRMFQYMTKDELGNSNNNSNCNSNNDINEIDVLNVIVVIIDSVMKTNKKRKEYMNYFYGEGFIMALLNTLSLLSKESNSVFVVNNNNNNNKTRTTLSIIKHIYSLLSNLSYFGHETEMNFIKHNRIISISENIINKLHNKQTNTYIYNIITDIILLISNLIADEGNDSSFIESILFYSSISSFIKHVLTNTTCIGSEYFTILNEITLLLNTSFDIVNDDTLKDNLITQYHLNIITIITTITSLQKETIPQSKRHNILIHSLSFLIKIISYLRNKSKLSSLQTVLTNINKMNTVDVLGRLSASPQTQTQTQTELNELVYSLLTKSNLN